MDERCRRFHAKLLSGTCPWCGAAVVNGEVTGAIDYFDQAAIDFATTESAFEFSGSGYQSLYQMVIDNGRLDCRAALKYIQDVANQLEQIHNAARFHGSVFPENIFVDDKGGATLLLVGRPLIGQVFDTGIVIEENGRAICRGGLLSA